MMSLQRHQQEAGFEIVTAEPRKALLPESSFMEGRGHLVENASVSPSEISSACTKPQRRFNPQACSGYVQVFKDGRGHVGGFGGTQCQARDRTAVSKLPRERRLLATAVELEDSEQNMERGRPPVRCSDQIGSISCRRAVFTPCGSEAGSTSALGPRHSVGVGAGGSRPSDAVVEGAERRSAPPACPK
ncbi:unnamed protein product [Lampetra planeri]